METQTLEHSNTRTLKRFVANAHVVTPGSDCGIVNVLVEGERVAAVGRGVAKPAGASVVDLDGGLLLPGFIDVHSHGRSGFDFCDATDEAFDVMARDRLQDGVTGYLATGLTLPEEELAEMCRCAERSKSRCVGATCFGVHLEGPFFPPECAGAQNPAHLRKPDLGFVERLNAISRVLKVSFAPELEGAEDFTRALVARGIVASCGHSAADWDCFQRARAAGLTHVTHFCNVVTPLHHLRPGVVGAGLLADDVYVELICDGVHVHDPMLEIISRLKGPDRMMVITDSMRAAGCPDGDYSLGGLPVVVAGGCARIKNADGSPGPIAGSTCRYFQGVQRLARVTGWPLEKVVRSAALNQARSLGIPDRGEIAPGKFADFVAVDDSLAPRMTFVRGELMWEKS